MSNQKKIRRTRRFGTFKPKKTGMSHSNIWCEDCKIQFNSRHTKECPRCKKVPKKKQRERNSSSLPRGKMVRDKSVEGLDSDCVQKAGATSEGSTPSPLAKK